MFTFNSHISHFCSCHPIFPPSLVPSYTKYCSIWNKLWLNKWLGFCLLPPAPRAKLPPKCVVPSPASMKRRNTWSLVYFRRFAPYDLRKQIYIKDHDKKDIKRFLLETVGALGGMLGDGVHVESVQPRVRRCRTQSSRGEQTKDQPAW